jgi:hypothetical protein
MWPCIIVGSFLSVSDYTRKLKINKITTQCTYRDIYTVYSFKRMKFNSRGMLWCSGQHHVDMWDATRFVINIFWCRDPFNLFIVQIYIRRGCRGPLKWFRSATVLCVFIVYISIKLQNLDSVNCAAHLIF